MMHILRLLIRTFLVLLLGAFGAAVAFALPGDWAQASYPVAAQELSAQPVHLMNAARAPPATDENLASTGAAFARTGGVGPRGAALTFDGDFLATNTGTGSRFADQVKLDDHFNRHGVDFGATSSTQYQQMADDFLTGPRGPNTLERIRANGDVVRYDPTTDAFGVVSSNGTIRTYYVPDPAVHGYPSNLDYFNAQ